MTALRRCSFVQFVLPVALLLAGSFHEYVSCILSVAMGGYLLVRIQKNQGLFVRKSLLALSMTVLCAGYGMTCLWAVDRGMALVGFFKFLPLVLYLLCLWQTEGESNLLSGLPVLGAVLTVISAVLMVLPGADGLFSVADRLAGVFQYPNAFAAFLTVCLLALLQKENRRWFDWGSLPVLIAGILYTGSRTVFALALVACAVMLFLSVKQKGKLLLLGLLGVGVLTAVLLLLSDNPVFARFFRFSLTESTLVGRLLYYADALPLLLKYPFGMGYLGYYYTQGSIQTGVYTVTYIHNEPLQLLLDIGWIPAGLFFLTVGRWLFRKDVNAKQKLVVGTLCAHCLLDFDLQFVAMFMLLLGLMDDTSETKVKWKANGLLSGAVAIIAAVSLYMALPLGLSQWGAKELAHKLYPYDTQNMLSMLQQETELERANALADKILEQNTAHYGAYSAKAKYSYSRGDFAALIQYKEAVFQANPFDHREYEEYCQMLLNGIMLYEKAGDTASAEVCRQQLLQTVSRLAENAKRLSKLGTMIKDQPVTELPAELENAIIQATVKEN